MTPSRLHRPLISEDELFSGLQTIRVRSGGVVLVHTSLSRFGTVVGGEQTVIAALRRTVGASGTLVMPAQSWQLCDPDFLDDPAVPAAARPRLRDALPAFEVSLTPTRSMGAVAELFRLQPGTHRSPHPHRSFSAAGPAARQITEVHDPASPFGETSPLARLYELDAQVLLLGVGFDACTSLHLAERRAAGRAGQRLVANGAPMSIAGRRRWIRWEEPAVDDADFVSIGAAFEEAGGVASVTIGAAQCRVMSMVALVDFAVRCMDGTVETETACRDSKNLSEC